MGRICHLAVLGAVLVALLIQPASAQDQARIDAAHDLVRDSLIHLTVTNQMLDSGAQEIVQGTAFFVSDQGYALTTAHLFRPPRAFEAQLRSNPDLLVQTLAARVGSADAAERRAAYISEIASLDLVLVRVMLPFDARPPKPLEMESADALLRRGVPQLLTSGFNDHAYRRLQGVKNDTAGDDVPYAWTINVKTLGGQSGSPVYLPDGDTVKVIGLLKGTARADDERSLMIPIDYAMPLIGHLRMDRLEAQIAILQGEIAGLRQRLGDAAPDAQPLFPRVTRIEPVVDQVQNHVSWQPELREDGSIIILGRRLVRESLIPTQVNYMVTPTVTYRGVTSKRPPLDGELTEPRRRSDQLTLEYFGPGFESALASHIQRKLSIPQGESYTIDAIEIAISLPQTGIDAAEKFALTLNREVTAR